MIKNPKMEQELVKSEQDLKDLQMNLNHVNSQISQKRGELQLLNDELIGYQLTQSKLMDSIFKLKRLLGKE